MEGMRDILRSSLARSLRTMREEDRLSAAWPVACGRVLAERGSVAGFAEGVVRIEVADGIWMRQMMSLRGQLESELTRIAGVRVAEIHFEVKKS
jgi:hypothetical protein